MKKILKILFLIFVSVLLANFLYIIFGDYYAILFPLFFVGTFIFIFFIKILKINLEVKEFFIYFVIFSFVLSIGSIFIGLQNKFICKYFSSEIYFCKKFNRKSEI